MLGRSQFRAAATPYAPTVSPASRRGGAPARHRHLAIRWDTNRLKGTPTSTTAPNIVEKQDAEDDL